MLFVLNWISNYVREWLKTKGFWLLCKSAMRDDVGGSTRIEATHKLGRENIHSMTTLKLARNVFE